MQTNVLSSEQSNFDPGVAGWESAGGNDGVWPWYSGPPNLLWEEQATFGTNHLMGGSTANFVCGWASSNAINSPASWRPEIPALRVSYGLSADPTIAVQRSGVTTRFPAPVGKTYTFMARIRLTGGAQATRSAVSLTQRFRNSAGTIVQTATSPTTTTRDAWVDVRYVATASAADSFDVEFYLTWSHGGVGSYIDITRAGVFDGDVATADWHAPRESWAQNLLDVERATMETNTQTAPTNLVACGWYCGAISNRAAFQSNEYVWRGRYSVRSGFITSSTLWAQVGETTTPYIRYFPAVPGRAYAAEVMKKPATGSPTNDLQLIFVNDALTTIATTTDLSMAPGNDWRKLAARGVCPVGATKFSVLARCQGANADAMWVDQAAVYDCTASFAGRWCHPDSPPVAPALDPLGNRAMAVSRMGTAGDVSAFSSGFPASVGQYWSAWAKLTHTSADRPAKVIVEFLDATGAVLSSATDDVALHGSTAPAGTVYTQGMVTGVAPAGTTTVRMRVSGVNLPANTALMVEQAALSVGQPANLLPEGSESFENTDGWWTDPTGQSTLTSVVDAAARDGTSVLRVARTSTPGVISLRSPSVPVGTVACTVNQMVTALADLRHSGLGVGQAENAFVVLGLEFLNGAGGVVARYTNEGDDEPSDTTGGTTLSTTLAPLTWKTLRAFGPVPATAVAARMTLDATGMSGTLFGLSDWLQVDKVGTMAGATSTWTTTVPPVATSGWRPTTDDLLQLRRVPRRWDDFRFELVDRRNRRIGDLHPDLDKKPTVVWDTGRDIKRTLDGFYLPASEMGDVNRLTDRVRVYQRMQDGAEFSLGVFLWSDANEPRRPWGYESEGTLLDKTYILDQPRIDPQSLPRYETPLVWFYHYVTSQLPEFNKDYWIQPDFRVDWVANVILYMLVVMGDEGAGKELGSPVNWQGGTTHLRMGNDIMKLVGYLPLHCDRNGTLIMRRGAPIESVAPTLSYELGTPIDHAAISDTTARLNIPSATGFLRSDNVPPQSGNEVDIAFDITPTAGTGARVIGGRWWPDQRSWLVYYDGGTASARINVAGVGGSTPITMILPTYAIPLGVRGRYRLTFTGNDGAGNRVARFYTAPSMDGPWTMVSELVTAGVVTLYPGTAPFAIGADPIGSVTGTTLQAPTSGFIGQIHEVRVYSTRFGTEYLRVRAADLPAGTSPFYDPAYGYLWTPNGTLSVVNTTRPAWSRWKQGRIIEESIVRSVDDLTAPNYVVVTDSAANQAPFRGIWRAPASAPYSEANRGYAVGKYMTVSGISTQEEANAVAVREAEYLLGAGDWVQWQSPADPRHDAYEVLTVLGNKMLEVSWAITCVSGQPMKHKALRVYPRDGAPVT